MHALLAIIVAVLSADTQDVQGIWQGTGRDARYSAAFCFDVLSIRVGTHPILAPRESRFSVDPEQGTIDILRDDGVQLGRYVIEGDKLTLTLADVNLQRPEAIEFTIAKPKVAPIFESRQTRKPWTQQQYLFERVR